MIIYRLQADARRIGARFNARTGDDPWPGGTLSPGNFAPVVTAGREFVAGPRPAGRPLEARLIPRVWGVPPPPAAIDATRGILTVRNPDSPFWIGNLKNSEFRCLVPASAFMVWGKGTDAEGRRKRHWFGCADQSVFAFAGVWKDSEIPSFAVLTCAANATLGAAGRDTMPVVLPADGEAWQTWLHSGWDRARTLLCPYPGSMMRELTT